MPLEPSGQITLNDIATEFGGSVPHNLSEYYDVADGIPSSGQISLSNFYGASASGGTGWDISTATYVQNFSVTAQESTPTGLFFKPDGTGMYVIGSSGDDINQYSLSTAWDISTATYVQNFSVNTQESTPTGLFFKPDGTGMYVIGSRDDYLNQYSLSTAWDISTAVYVQRFYVRNQASTATGLFFKPDGTSVYVIGSKDDAMHQYSLSTAWDISTTVYVQSFSVLAQEAGPAGLFFKPDGTSMYIIGYSGDDINQYSLSTAWDISAATYVQNFSVVAQEDSPRDLFFKPDGTSMYIIGSTGRAVWAYDL